MPLNASIKAVCDVKTHRTIIFLMDLRANISLLHLVYYNSGPPLLYIILIFPLMDVAFFYFPAIFIKLLYKGIRVCVCVFVCVRALAIVCVFMAVDLPVSSFSHLCKCDLHGPFSMNAYNYRTEI
jgi:hypothetical protein